MNHAPDDLRHLLHTAWQMPYGRAQVAAVEEIVRHADAQQVTDVQYAARILAISAYTYAGEQAKSFVPFAWCLAVYDRGDADPRYDHSLMWAFKHVVSGLTRFPEVPLDRTRAVLDDMERRYRLAGHSLNPVHMLRTKLADHLGDRVAAAEQYRLWCAAPRGELSDCIGCEPTGKAWHLRRAGQYEDALAVAAPVLTGSLTCVEQPAAILTVLLEPYVRTGRYAEAADAHRRAYRQLQGSRSDLEDIGEHIGFCARTGNPARAVELIQRHLGWLDQPPTPMADLTFSASAAHALRQVVAAGHGDLPVADRRAGDLADELAGRASALAARFDARNGTSAVGERTRAMLEASPLVDELPLSGAARRRGTASADRPSTDRPAVPAAAELPADPEALVRWARTQSRLGNTAAEVAAWARFDEVCPEPTGVLFGQRLLRSGAERMDAGDPDGAEQWWARAAEALTGLDDVRAAGARQGIGLLWCLTGRADEGFAVVEAEAAAIHGTGDTAARVASTVRHAHALRAVDRQDEALATARRAVTIAETGDDAALRAETTLFLARTLVAGGPGYYAEALEVAERAIALFGPLAPAETLHAAQFLAGRLHATTGDFAQAYPLFGEAARAVDPLQRGETLGLRGRSALELDRPADAVAAFADAVAALEEGDNPHGAAHARLDLARACADAERPEEAADVLEDAIGVLTAHDDAAGLLEAKSMLAACYGELRHLEQALVLFDEVAEQYATLGDHANLGSARGQAADLLDTLDRDEAAATRYEQAADAFAATDEAGRQLHNRRRAALAWHWAGEPARSAATLAAAEKLGATIVGDRPHADYEPWQAYELGMMHYDGARILSAQGEMEDATARAAVAVELFGVVGAVPQQTAARTLHGRLLAHLGRTEEARAELAAARDALPEDAGDRRAEITALIEEL